MSATCNLFENIRLSQGNRHVQSFINNTDEYYQNYKLLFIIKRTYKATNKSSKEGHSRDLIGLQDHKKGILKMKLYLEVSIISSSFFNVIFNNEMNIYDAIEYSVAAVL